LIWIRDISFFLTSELHTFALNNIINEVLDVSNIILRTTINEESILVINKTDLFDLKQKISLIKAKFFDFYTIDTTIFLTPVHDIKSLPESYSQLHRYIKTHFYFVKGKIVEANEFTRLLNKEVSYLNYDFNPLSKALKEGQVQLSTLELLNELLSHIPATSRVNYLKQFLNGINSTHLDVIHHQLNLFIQEIIQLYNEKNMLKYSPLINDIIKIIMHEISNPKLSLKWIAENMLYMNRDYLSKTFKKETGISFSTFLMNYRMDKACKMIADADENRITDIAENIGFGNNPAYFSRAFKKYTGMNPSQYKEKE
jgi:two-component system response regulator YesN